MAGLELNLYAVPGYFEVTGESIEDKQVQIVKAVKEAVEHPGKCENEFVLHQSVELYQKKWMRRVPMLMFYSTAFFQPEVDIDKEEYFYPWELSNPKDHMVGLRFCRFAAW